MSDLESTEQEAPAAPAKKRGRPRKERSHNETTWTIKGIQQETRDRVAKAAKRERQTIGSWVDRVLGDHALAVLQNKPPTELAKSNEEILSELLEANKTLSEKVDKLAAEAQKPFFSRLFGR